MDPKIKSEEIKPKEEKIEQSFGLLPPKTNWSKAKTVITIIVSVIVVFVVSLAIYTFIKQTAPNNPTQDFQTTNSNTDTQELENQNDKQISGLIEWQDPKKIENLGLFKVETLNAELKKNTTYYEVGTFNTGPFIGQTILNVFVPCDGPCRQKQLFRIIRKDNTFVMLQKYSDEYFAELFASGKTVNIDTDYKISDLEFPLTISGEEPNQALTFVDRLTELFKKDGLVQVFSEKKLGPVYTNILPDKPSKDLFKRNGYYVKSPDGTVKVYKLIPNFVNDRNVPNITWKDGTINAQEYTYSNYSSCGEIDYAAVISSGQLSKIKDLVQAGKTSKGDFIYTLKDQDHVLLKTFYDKTYIGDVESHEKVSYEDFLASHPLFFWVDPFDRLIQFTILKYLPPAGCD